MKTNRNRLTAWTGTATAGALLALCTTPATAATASPRVLSITNVSGQSPWHGLHCMSSNFWASGKPIVGEPSIAVNPLNPKAQAAAWIDLDAGRIDAAFTEDGGKTWHKASLPGTDPCTGKQPGGYAYEQGADPWLSYGVDGTLYLSSLMATNYAAPPPSKYNNWVYIQRATNNSDFTQPVVLPSRFNDFPNILADNSNPDTVYVVYVIGDAGIPIGDAGRGAIHFARSTDGGRTFTTKILASAKPDSYVHAIVPDEEYTASSSDAVAEAFVSPEEGDSAMADMMRYIDENYFWRTQMTQLADGTLAIISTFPKSLGGGTRTLVSRDRGETWTPASNVPAAPPTIPSINRCKYSLGLSSDGSHPVVLDGKTILLANAVNGGDEGPASIQLTSSDDAGKTWTRRTVFKSKLPLGLVRIATDDKGRIALAYDEADTASSIDCSADTPSVPVRTRFIVSADRGKTWSRPITLGASWWDAASGGARSGEKEGGGLFLGDYEDMIAVPGQGFAVTAIQGKPLTKDAGNPDVPGFKALIVAQVAVD